MMILNKLISILELTPAIRIRVFLFCHVLISDSKRNIKEYIISNSKMH